MLALTVVVPVELRPLVGSRFRRSPGAIVAVAGDGTSTVLHMVESIGIPRTEVGALAVGDRRLAFDALPAPGDVITVLPVARPQRGAPERFVLDVHLGALARRLRLMGVDAAYRNDATDEELVAQAVGEQRVLLTQDRGLLRRRALPWGAFVRGARPDEQLTDVLDRFAPSLQPWRRCPRCNGLLEPVELAEVAHLLEAGTRATYDVFSRCRGCGRPYWRGAHARALEAIVRRAMD